MRTKILSGVKILTCNPRKFLIYTPASLGHRERLRTISRATSKIAEHLGLDIEVTESDGVRSPYVFYSERDKGEVPLYSDLGKDWDEWKIYDSIRSVVYALSLLPEYGYLEAVRG